jgi:signal peptidase II
VKVRRVILSEPDLSFSDRAICAYTWVAPLVVVFDQLSKYLAEKFLVLQQPVAVLPSLNFTLAYNTGAAFSFLHQAGGWQNSFFIAVAVLMTAVLLVMLYRAQRGQHQFAIAIWMVLGGAVGNLIDRIRLQKVVDFIDFYIGQWNFATFNIADMAISVGAFLLILDSFNLYLIRCRQKSE